MKIFKLKTAYIFVMAAIMITVFALPVSALTTDGTIDSTYKYAWGENIGWINFGTTNGDVHITDSSLSGYALSETVGWINLNNVVNDGAGNLSGYAWSENTGYINFNPTNSRVIINSLGEFTGSALSENIGWIIFDCNTSACVKTDWLGQSARPQCNNSLDDDSDGLTDYPNDPGCSSLTDDDETDPSGGGFIPPAPPIIPNQTFEITIIENQPTINLSNVQNAYQIAISTTPDFKDVSWEPYQENIILPDVEKVYIKFRSQSGGVSEVYEVEVNQNNPNLPNGSLIRAINDFKVYIINNNYIRHILSGDIFDFYNHLNWNAIQEVSLSQLNSYQESFLIRELNDYKVYEINSDKTKRWLDMTAEEFANAYSWDEIYIINEEELKWYETGI